MQSLRPHTFIHGIRHASAIRKAHLSHYPSPHDPEVEGNRNAHDVHDPAHRKKQKFLQKRLRGGHVSIPRSSSWSVNTDEEAVDYVDFSATEMCPASYASLLRVCTKRSLHRSGMHLHHLIIKNGLDGILVLQNLLVQMYNECALMYDASHLFDLIHFRDEFLWNFMIRACSQNGVVIESTQMFDKMLREGILPNKFCYTSLVLAYSSHEELTEGKHVLARLVGISFESDVLLENALLSMCCKCAGIGDARQLFDRLYERDVVSWNAMIAVHGKQGKFKDALFYFKDMQQSGILPNETTFICVLDACADGSVMFEGRFVHACFAGTDLERNLVLGTALMNLYGKQGDLREAQRVFDQLSEQSTVSWNGLITAYVLHSQGKNALMLFHQMLQQGVMPDNFVFISMFSAHATKEDLVDGKRMYSRLFGFNLDPDHIVITAVLNMFCKCGSIGDAEEIFDLRKSPDVIMWTSMIAGYAQHGHGRKALELFNRMQLEGPNPNQATFTSVLTACSKEGLVDDGVRHFLSMSREYGIEPLLDHYNCVIDLLAKSGRLDEAEDLIASMSTEVGRVAWTSFLDACRKHSDTQRGRRAANSIFKLGLFNSSSFVILSNLTVSSA